MASREEKKVTVRRGKKLLLQESLYHYADLLQISSEWPASIHILEEFFMTV